MDRNIHGHHYTYSFPIFSGYTLEYVYLTNAISILCTCYVKQIFEIVVNAKNVRLMSLFMGVMRDLPVLIRINWNVCFTRSGLKRPSSMWWDWINFIIALLQVVVPLELARNINLEVWHFSMSVRMCVIRETGQIRRGKYTGP